MPSAPSKDDVERCKQKDLLEQMMAEMIGEFPDLHRTIVSERDVYLTYMLRQAARRLELPRSSDGDGDGWPGRGLSGHRRRQAGADASLPPQLSPGSVSPLWWWASWAWATSRASRRTGPPTSTSRRS